ncbi:MULTISPECIES: PQQ-dependent sugar dehydrogenase [unclassified Rhizobium]|uniref:PQQ-dependent sugar dehydrogenase n=1 Tax=unclassified Rhizobium TaxID=2613769 RepID=UPI000DDE8B95|nr:MULTISPECIES: PQQ-dependent sugar dehydrogenase [unclassified Rhizobium]MBB3287651.1 glucose/arabinose dehydrogenase [Rhizobium sp. BK252]MBB3402745.1 glucose/arabinose dehydrogenase [Rhizobium sp. BK289]MBB3415321.1 glucose/arabinose dehydrogenase [Rhizobium sp. BK284]MBB3483210.1 glucose/arabinose dehydrogenase [Rhizobium sp. BK347]
MRTAGTGFSMTLMACALLTATSALAEPAETIKTQKIDVKVEAIATGLEHPWAVEVLPDGAYLVTERPGRMRLIRDGKISTPLSGLPEVYGRGQGGLLDVALDPKFASNRTLYFTASVAGDGGSGTAVFRARLSQDEKQLTDVKRIFLMNKLSRGNIQYGSRIAIARDGSLFVSLGDRGQQDRAQDFQDDAGSIIHIEADGSIPADNPFKDGRRALPEIWSKGHRNPQGIAFDSQTNRLYTAEHGARGGDEINTPEAGKNYGWPVISYGVNYSGTKIGVGTAKAGMEQPRFYWDPSIAPGAIAVYRGKMFPEWNGDFLVTALKFELLSRLSQDGKGRIGERERMFDGKFGRLRDITVAPDGALLITTDEEDGALLRVSRAAG